MPNPVSGPLYRFLKVRKKTGFLVRIKSGFWIPKLAYEPCKRNIQALDIFWKGVKPLTKNKKINFFSSKMFQYLNIIIDMNEILDKTLH